MFALVAWVKEKITNLIVLGFQTVSKQLNKWVQHSQLFLIRSGNFTLFQQQVQHLPNQNNNISKQQHTKFSEVKTRGTKGLQFSKQWPPSRLQITQIEASLTPTQFRLRDTMYSTDLKAELYQNVMVCLFIGLWDVSTAFRAGWKQKRTFRAESYVSYLRSNSVIPVQRDERIKLSIRFCNVKLATHNQLRNYSNS